MNAAAGDGQGYSGEHLDRIAFPMGGIGAGMICLEGTGALSHVSVRNHPNVFNEPLVFSALCVKGSAGVARVLEGPVPRWKLFGPNGAGNGGNGKNYGLPRFAEAEFHARFPFGTVTLRDPAVPLDVELTGWSPFVPGDADASSLPVAGLEYRLTNSSKAPVEAVYSFHARNFMAVDGVPGERVDLVRGGFVLWQPGSEEKPAEEGAFSAAIDDSDVKVNCLWFRGGWFDSLTSVWKSVAEGTCPQAGPVPDGPPSPGGSLYLPLSLAPGEQRTIRLRLGWYVPRTTIRTGEELPADQTADPATATAAPRTHEPWYAGHFAGIGEVDGFWRREYDKLRAKTQVFSDCFYDTTLPDEVVDAVAANLTILKAPTVLRQKDGRLWCWEGCCDGSGCCAGSCTHVWNYAQATAHLFPALERSLRETEFFVSQDERGHQTFRSALPIRPVGHKFHAAADGQLGGIMKVFREWRISGDSAWLKRLWPKVRKSLVYAMETWDPDHGGTLVEPHHNTYDIEFWGADGMCTSFYLGALQAAVLMGQALNEDVALFEAVLDKGRAAMEGELFDGEYFIQKIQWEGLRAPNPVEAGRQDKGGGQTPEALALMAEEGPKYQYGSGCISDGVLGIWLAEMCGVPAFLDREKVTSHLVAVHRHNFRADLSTHANPQRPTYAAGRDGGLLLCSWPKGGALTLPFVYSDEVWTGIEYQVASHLMLTGHVDEGLEIVRTARARYDGKTRNPFNEYECGHWYGRALASYGLLQGLTGARYDAVSKVLTIAPRISGDCRAFLATATGFGTVGVRSGEPFVEVKYGTIDVARIDCAGRAMCP